MAVSYNSCALIITENKYSLGEHDRSFSFVLWIKFTHSLDYARQKLYHLQGIASPWSSLCS